MPRAKWVKKYKAAGRCAECGARPSLAGYQRCVVCRKRQGSWYLKTKLPRWKCSDKGAAAEHFVISDLLNRHLPTGGPYNQNGKHDLFVKISGLWLTVQVKAARVVRSTGHLVLSNGGRRITSDLVAIVDLPTKRIRWMSRTKAPVPKELLDET